VLVVGTCSFIIGREVKMNDDLKTYIMFKTEGDVTMLLLVIDKQWRHNYIEPDRGESHDVLVKWTILATGCYISGCVLSMGNAMKTLAQHPASLRSGSTRLREHFGGSNLAEYRIGEPSKVILQCPQCNVL
jgi:hypothetical protein